jgi:hypothetical protein
MKLFTAVHDDTMLLEAFLGHYAAAGIDEFHIAVPSALAPTIAPLVEKYDVNLHTASAVVDVNYGSANVIGELRGRHQGDDEWVVIVDLDEFVDFTDDIADILASAEAEGANVVRGTMFDRFSVSGKIVGSEAGSDPAKAYPIKARFARNVMLGYDQKGVLVRGRLTGVPGADHHWFVGERIASANLEIAHYKWTPGSVDRLKDRCPQLRRAGTDWVSVYERAIDHYESHGRFAWEQFGGQPIGHRAERVARYARGRLRPSYLAYLAAVLRNRISRRVGGSPVEAGARK